MSKNLDRRPTLVPGDRESTRKIKAITEDAKLICAGVKEFLHELGPIIEEIDGLLWRAKGLMITFILTIEALLLLVIVLLLRHG